MNIQSYSKENSKPYFAKSLCKSPNLRVRVERKSLKGTLFALQMRAERGEIICNNDGTRYLLPLVSDVSIFQVHIMYNMAKMLLFFLFGFVYLSDCMPHTYI